MAKTVNHALGSLTLGDDGIVTIVLSPTRRLNVEDIVQGFEAHLELVAGVPHPLIVDASRVHGMSREAMQAAKEHPVSTVITRSAVLVSSPVTVVLLRFLMTISRPSFPMRGFRKVGDARAWLLANGEE